MLIMQHAILTIQKMKLTANTKNSFLPLKEETKLSIMQQELRWQFPKEPWKTRTIPKEEFLSTI